MGRLHIISAAVGYKPRNISTFLGSLRLLPSNSTVWMIVRRRDLKEWARLRTVADLEVQFYPVCRPCSVWVNRLARMICSVRAVSLSNYFNNRATRFLLQLSLPVSSLRYFCALEIVGSTLLENDDWLLLVDSRDAYFQCCPLEYVADNERLILLAEEPRPLVRENINYRWLESLYGRKFAESLLGCQIACSGTTMGPIEKIARYLRCMCLETLRLRRRLWHTFGYDQGIHNFIVHNELVGDVRWCKNGHGFVWTGARPQMVDAEGVVVNIDGRPVSVVHQYDRHLRYFESLGFFKKIRTLGENLIQEMQALP